MVSVLNENQTSSSCSFSKLSNVEICGSGEFVNSHVAYPNVESSVLVIK